jgi:hypothetical protein
MMRRKINLNQSRTDTGVKMSQNIKMVIVFLMFTKMSSIMED